MFTSPLRAYRIGASIDRYDRTPMSRETQRHLALLAIVGTLAVAWAIALRDTAGAGAANTAAPRPARADPAAACPFPRGLRGAFEAAALDASLPPAMLYAVAKVESNLRPGAESSAGARGLLQLMPATARMLNLDAGEPRTNVLAGARYLRRLLDELGSSDLALAAYNAGPTAVRAAGGAPTAGVLRYVANVNELWRAHAGCR
jgi:soluble lytic murein transglycosylase-like protein